MQQPPMMGYNPYQMMPMMGMQNQFMQQFPMHPPQQQMNMGWGMSQNQMMQ
jgi:hypothetical protein